MIVKSPLERARIAVRDEKKGWRLGRILKDFENGDFLVALDAYAGGEFIEDLEMVHYTRIKLIPRDDPASLGRALDALRGQEEP